MDLAVIYGNIERLLEQKGRTGNDVSSAAGVPDAIRNIKRKLDGQIKGNGISVKTLDAIAAELEVTAEYLKTPRERSSRATGGVRDALLAKIAWLDRERADAIRELEEMDQAESAASRRLKRAGR